LELKDDIFQLEEYVERRIISLSRSMLPWTWQSRYEVEGCPHSCIYVCMCVCICMNEHRYVGKEPVEC
jgi:hypothetical protein